MATIGFISRPVRAGGLNVPVTRVRPNLQEMTSWPDLFSETATLPLLSCDLVPCSWTEVGALAPLLSARQGLAIS
jgi:hypothetical protein